MLFKKTLNIAANQRAAQFPGNWKIEERSETVRNDEPKKREPIYIDTLVPFPSLCAVYTKHVANYSYLKIISTSSHRRNRGHSSMKCPKRRRREYPVMDYSYPRYIASMKAKRLQVFPSLPSPSRRKSFTPLDFPFQCFYLRGVKRFTLE